MGKKQIKIASSGCTRNYKVINSFIGDLLGKHGYGIIESSLSDADYVVCGPYDKTSRFLECNGIRIMWSGENYVPDFNLVDYAVSVYPIEYFDRHFRYPQCLSGYLATDKSCIQSRESCFNEDILKKKTRFANFIFSHESVGGQEEISLKSYQNIKELIRLDHILIICLTRKQSGSRMEAN